jgi:Domain of unknown function (DUF4258)
LDAGSGVSETLSTIVALASKGAIHFSDHAFEKIRKDDILPSELIDGLNHAQVVEDYPDAKRGPSVLVLFRDPGGKPVHAVWGIPRNRRDIAVLITAYRPDPNAWTDNFLKRTNQ